MKNEVKIKFCPTCYAYLSSFGERNLSFYESVCSHYAANFKILARQGPKGSGESMIEFLEKKGYISTTEISSSDLLVKPIGYHVKNNQHSFCMNEKDHSKLSI